jgi:hypothetical protein
MSNENKNISAKVKTLQNQRDVLRKRLEEIEQDYKKGLSADSEEQAVELENAEVLDGIAKATAEELQKIEEELSTLKNS